MKIPRPKPPETEFKRKRSPPPQATKLLVASLSAGLVFMALLAIVFVPRYLENLNRPPTATLQVELNTTAGATQIDVTYAVYDLPLSLFNATLSREDASGGTVPVANLSSGLAGADAGLTFTDANHDGLLDAGDYFTLPAGPQATYHFEIWQGNVDARVGALVWTGSI